MTEEERDRLILEKAKVTQALAEVSLRDYHLSRIDKRLSAYVSEVAKNPKGHNLWEQLAVMRFLSMIEKYGIQINIVQRFFRFYEALSFPGKQGMTKYKLTPVQCFQYASIFGFWRGDRRVVRDVCLFVPRKYSKTTSSAAFAVWDVLFGDSNAECYAAANSQDQAKKVFDAIRGCFFQLDPTGNLYRVNEQIVKSIRGDRTAFAQCLTSGARTKNGLNASTVIMDEFSQAKDNSLLTVLTTSMGVRDNPLTVIITTASDVFEGPFYSMLQGYKQVLLGEFEDDSLFAHLFEPDVGDAEDDPATWRKVHPHLGVTVNADFYEQEYKKAKRDGAEAMLAFRTKLLNIYTENEQKSWLSGTLARSISKPLALDKLKGRPDGMVAIDLSESDDFSAVTVGIYDSRTYSYAFHTAYFFPEGALPGHPNEALYRGWAQAGHLHLTKGDVIDYREIVEHVLQINRHVRVLRIGYDAYKAQDVVNMLRASVASLGGNPADILRPVGQTHGQFTAPVEAFEHGAKTGKITIDDNPINAFCFANAVLDYDNNDNCKPMKRRQSMKIDGLITMLMCLRLFIDYIG